MVRITIYSSIVIAFQCVLCHNKTEHLFIDRKILKIRKPRSNSVEVSRLDEHKHIIIISVSNKSL